MATATDDPRIQKIESTQVYGIYHEGMLIYVGQSTIPLSKRLIFHRAGARHEKSKSYYNLLQRYIREHVESPYHDLSIHPLPYDSESRAISELGDGTLNIRGGDEPYLGGYAGYDWSPEEVNVLEEVDTIEGAAEKLDVPYSQCRNAALKLGIANERELEPWTEEEVEMLGTDTDKAVAEELGRSWKSVSWKRKKLNIDAPGHQRHRRELSMEEAEEAYRRSLKGESYASIAEDLPITRHAVGKIVRSESYHDLDRESIEEEVGGAT